MTNSTAIEKNNKLTPNEAADIRWRSHAYPLKRITVSVQCTRHGNKESLITLLEAAIERIKAGQEEGTEHDDDFGYRFLFHDDSHHSIFSEPAGYSSSGNQTETK